MDIFFITIQIQVSHWIASEIESDSQSPARAAERNEPRWRCRVLVTTKPIQQQLADQQIKPLVRSHLRLETNAAIVDVILLHSVTSDPTAA